jgi:hypothetical protein
VHADFANAVLATVTHIEPNPLTGEAAVVFVRPDEWGDAHRAPLAIHPHRGQCRTHGRDVIRTQFPLIPAHAMTVHRVQGSTLECDVHILLNAEARRLPPKLSRCVPAPSRAAREPRDPP